MASTEDGPPPSATIYIKNIDEKRKIPEVIESIRDTFSLAGEIVDIVAKKNLKARGQAFVVFDSIDSAKQALELLQGFDLFDRPMHLAYAKTRSDTTVLREDGEDGLEKHKRHRMAEKERKQALEAAKEQQQQKSTKRPGSELIAERPAKASKATAAGSVTDEYLPPNKILFLRDLPEDYGKENIAMIFSRFKGFKEVRLVPGRTGIAFVEYENEEGAISAKEATTGITLGDKAVRVTYQRG